MNLLNSDEKGNLLGSGPDSKHTHHKDGRCLPDWGHSPEESELDRLRNSGLLKSTGVDNLDSDADHDNTQH